MAIELVIKPRSMDLGGFSVRRILPYATHRMVGPFIFFDHMGPAEFAPGDGLVVRPHPHIHLATVTYLFEGKIRHRDSLGSDQLIEPGAVNWMTAGRGIVHSERAPQDLKERGYRMSGIQLWVALPQEHENTEPSFVHHPAASIPEFDQEGVRLRLILGSAFGHESPVETYSEMFYLEARMPRGSRLLFPNRDECAVYVVSGQVRADGNDLREFYMAVGAKGEDLELEALEDSRVMILGGKSVGERFIYWNFVSSSCANIDDAKAEWAKGPGTLRFPKIPGDDFEFIPLPEEAPQNPKGTPL